MATKCVHLSGITPLNAALLPQLSPLFSFLLILPGLIWRTGNGRDDHSVIVLSLAE